MPGKPITILGLSPGTSALGYAVLSDGELVDWGFKCFKGKWTSKKGKKIERVISQLVQKYQVSRIALKTCRPVHTTRNLRGVYRMIGKYSQDHNLSLTSTTIESLKRNCLKAKNKTEIRQFLVRNLPELNVGLLNSTRLDCLRQIEAIAVAYCSS